MKISVIIATYNRYVSLSKILQSLIDQEIDGSFNYEIIVVDNNSTDRTKETIESFINKDIPILYIFEPKQGKSNALNTGIRNSQSEVIAFTDDDVILDKSWILNIVKFSIDHDFDAVGGRVLPLYLPQAPKWVTENKVLLAGPIVCHDHGESILLYDRKMVPFIGANMLVKREVFEEVGNFNSDIGAGKGSMGEDTDLFVRIQDAGKVIYYNPKISVMHPVEKDRMTFSYIAKWSFMAGKYTAFKTSKKEYSELICYWGIPRYLLPKFIKNLFSFILTIGNSRAFIICFRNLFIIIGMVSYYQECYQKKN